MLKLSRTYHTCSSKFSNIASIWWVYIFMTSHAIFTLKQRFYNMSSMLLAMSYSVYKQYDMSFMWWSNKWQFIHFLLLSALQFWISKHCVIHVPYIFMTCRFEFSFPSFLYVIQISKSFIGWAVSTFLNLNSLFRLL